MLQFIKDHMVTILAAWVALEQVLGSVPSIKSSSLFQVIINTIDSVVNFLKPAPVVPPAPPAA